MSRVQVEIPRDVERVVLARDPGLSDWEVLEDASYGAVPGIETKELVAVEDLPGILEASLQSSRTVEAVAQLLHRESPWRLKSLDEAERHIEDEGFRAYAQRLLEAAALAEKAGG